MALDVLLVVDDTFDAVDSGRRLAFGQQLQRPHAIATDGGQQVEGFGGSGLEACGYAPADGVTVGQQAFEVMGDMLASQRFVVEIEGQRQGDRPAAGRGKPAGVVLQLHVAACRQGPAPDEFAVGPERQGLAV